MLVIATVTLTARFGTFPESWNVGLAEPINDARRWLIANQTDHWLYTAILDPISGAVERVFGAFEDLLTWVPFPAALSITAVALGATVGRLGGIAAVIGVAHAAAIGLWDEYLQTLALTLAAVVLALAIGVPIGIASSQRARFRALLRPILDMMQTMPAFVYLIPAALLFGIGLVPSVLATVVFALPPVVRLTDAGIRQVESEPVEASRLFGATERQTMTKVRIPLARPAILAGINQTILLAVSMVVIAGFIGAGGLGQVVLRSLRDLDVGRASEAGFAIVIMAITLDRFTAGLARSRTTVEAPRSWPLITAIGLVGITIVSGAFGWNEPPSWLDLSYRDSINSGVDWTRDNLFDIAGSGIGTGPFSDFLTIRLITPLRETLAQDLSWVGVVVLVAMAGFKSGGVRLGATIAICLIGIGLLGMWDDAMDTTAQVIVALALCAIIGVPVGVLAARQATINRLSKPILDFLQTIPSFVLLVPVIILFRAGRVPGIIAAVLYAIPATIRLTTLAFQSVDKAAVEASRLYGATGLQTLGKVELPLARPLLMTAVNQTIMLVLSMVVIAGLVGGDGLGLETVRGLRRSDSVGTGFEAGLAIVLLAVTIDRLTENAGRRTSSPPSHRRRAARA